LTHQDNLNKCNLTWLGIAVGALIIFSLLLTLHYVFADDYVICENKVWYPKGTDCKATLEKYGYVVKYPNNNEVEEEKAAQEDATCDNEDADTTNIRLCMSDYRKNQFEDVENTQERNRAADHICDDMGGKMRDDGCDLGPDPDEKKADRFNERLDALEEANVDKSIGFPNENEATETKEEREAEEQEYIAELEDDLADASTDEEKERISTLLGDAKATFNDKVSEEEREKIIEDVKAGRSSVPDELEGKLTKDEKEELAKSNYDWEYEWEGDANADGNPVPGTPSYKAPNQRESIKKFNDDGSHDLDGDPSTGIEIDDPVSASHERNEEEPVEINNDTPQVTPNLDDEANMDRSYEYEGSDEDSIKEAQEADDKYLDVGEGEPESEPVENIIASPKVELEDVDNPTDYQKKILDKIEEEEEFEEDEYQAEEDDEADEESEDDSGDSEESGNEDSSNSDDGEDSENSSDSEE
jgi:hypothetical protein